MNTEQAIACFERQCASGICTEADKIALAALREQAKRMNPEPLTLEELRQMAEQPYWHKSLQSSDERWLILPNAIAEQPEYYHYREAWLAYRYPPKDARMDAEGGGQE